MTIATAVEEQSATTNQTARNVAVADKGSGEITRKIEGVGGTRHCASAQDSQEATNELAEISLSLRGIVEQFDIGETGPSPDIASVDNKKAMAAHA